MKFEKAMANVVMFQNEDVVTTSCDCTPGANGSGKNSQFKKWICTDHHPNGKDTKNNATSCGNPDCMK